MSAMSSCKETSDAPFKNMVQRMWKTREFSDLTIMAEDREFSVHKNIVCPASPSFKAVCSEDLNVRTCLLLRAIEVDPQQDIPTNSIGVSEPASVIEELLQNIYGHSPDIPKLLEDPIAAYQITGIAGQIYEAIIAMACEEREYPHAPRLFVAIGQIIFEYRKIVNTAILECYVEVTYDLFRYILADDVAWGLLILSPDYYEEVIRKAYEEYLELEGEHAPSYNEMGEIRSAKHSISGQ
ncbi:uncharacterized protein MYCFIDRAFT_197960 [Pseudocercospora fijiensis CIRAD86]|uniref:BTB domain-containing protein n=1 Tax=Pseudocercospora fijiensis (strain CIRAD86) TaxID=383855 RepID=M3AUL2_PSEFD|nr:uncharacterized protein MYCFIDRAFT_197960 [Pseudocercospora fijiensis CIRAD86]EME81162.1 hypothetical protein MYCFIDRAFT_197960 [Pseudocercospora fijiensis CIRAD86]